MTRRERREAERAIERTQGSLPAIEEAILGAEAPEAAAAAADAATTEAASSSESIGRATSGAAEGERPASIPPGSRGMDVWRAWEVGARRAAARASRTITGTVGRVVVAGVLAIVTIAAPLSIRYNAAAANAQMNASTSTAIADQSQTGGQSVAAAVLGSDADFTEGDSELSNVLDAATLAKIREAYQLALTCNVQAGGASGEASAFARTAEVVNPMVQGTYTVSSPFGYRIHPTLGYLKLHAGSDYAAAVGTPIYAIAEGTVVEAGMSDDTGTVTIEHHIGGQTWYSRYLHMYEDGIYVKVGDQVSAGQLIAGVGNTGRSTGAHLHFEMRTANDYNDSSAVDPSSWLSDHNSVELTQTCS